jgi:hypothetical protein
MVEAETSFYGFPFATNGVASIGSCLITHRIAVVWNIQPLCGLRVEHRAVSVEKSRQTGRFASIAQ